jgi:hypothetical protein
MARGARANHRASMHRKKDKVEGKQLALHERIHQFELFNETVMPQLQKMVLENWSPDKIRRAFAPLVQARMIQEGLKGNFQAMKDTMDRYEGTAVQRQETITRYAKMDKKEMAALALQKLMDAGIIDVTGKRLNGKEEE